MASSNERSVYVDRSQQLLHDGQPFPNPGYVRVADHRIEPSLPALEVRKGATPERHVTSG
jgi:hypothetical protein